MLYGYVIRIIKEWITYKLEIYFYHIHILNTSLSMNENLIYGFFLALAIVLVILGSISLSAAGKSDSTNKTNAKNSSTGVLVIGLIFLLGSVYMLYDNYKDGKLTLYYY